MVANLYAGDPQIGIFMATDAGQIKKGEDIDVLTSQTELEDYLMIRNYFNVGYTNQLDEKNLISVGVGGLFWHDYNSEGEASADKSIKFGPGVSHAFFKYSISENMHLQFGYLPYKYNTPAKNLGEYLFRTEAYPTIVRTGGWSLMNSANYNTVGARLSWNLGDGLFNQDFTFFMENFNSPIYDLTPAYIANVKPVSGITLGGAVSCHRCFTPTPDTETSKIKGIKRPYAYVKGVAMTPKPTSVEYKVTNINPDNGEPFTINVFLDYWGSTPNIDSLKNQVITDYTQLGDAGVTPATLGLEEVSLSKGVEPGSLFDGDPGDLKDMDPTAFATVDTSIVDSVNGVAVPRQYQYVTFDNTAIKLISFFELDIRAFMGKGPGEFPEFNLYGEFALLGTKNYPIYYTKTSERFITMLGMSIPIPFVLDHLSVEMEYLNNPQIQSMGGMYDDLIIIPHEEYRYDDFTADDLKWSVHASRKLGPAFTIYLQVANDHLRPQNGFGQPTFIPVTHEKDHWYWMTRLQWAY